MFCLDLKPKKVGKGGERKNNNYRSVSLLPDSLQKIPKKIEKKIRKFKNIVVASFPAKISWNRPRNRENKNCHSVSFQPDA